MPYCRPWLNISLNEFEVIELGRHYFSSKKECGKLWNFILMRELCKFKHPQLKLLQYPMETDDLQPLTCTTEKLNKPLLISFEYTIPIGQLRRWIFSSTVSQSWKECDERSAWNLIKPSSATSERKLREALENLSHHSYPRDR